jgi:hypothetical protein
MPRKPAIVKTMREIRVSISDLRKAGSNCEAERLSLLLPFLRALAEADVERQAGEAMANLLRRKAEVSADGRYGYDAHAVRRAKESD